MTDFMFGVSDRAGGGGYSTARIIADVLKGLGYYVYESRSVHSNIKGLPTSFYFRVSESQVLGLKDSLDVLFAFDAESLMDDIQMLKREGLLICDNSSFNPTPKGKPINLEDFSGFIKEKELKVIALDMAHIARTQFKDPIVRNTMALGVASYVFGIEKSIFYRFIEKTYGSKRNEVLIANKSAFEIGYQKAEGSNVFRLNIEKLQDPGRLFMLGDELIGFGAIVGGCRFFAGYPITPASEVFEMMMAHLSKFGGVAVQAPSELAAAGYVIGASYAGVRAMTATSGPGFDLMQEWISSSGISEVPLVIVLVQRSGPGTGLPTRTSQEDLEAALYGGHGDFPRIVISPGTPEECFYFSAEMFNLAERYQCPVILLSEQCVGQARYTLDDVDISKVRIDRGKTILGSLAGKEYRRYQITSDGISPRALPGLSEIAFMTNANEHNESGFADESVQERTAQMRKRMLKTKTIFKEGLLFKPEIYGDCTAKIGFIGYGGVHGPIIEAISHLAREGITTKFMRLKTLMPLHTKDIRDFIASCSKVFFVEGNYTGQLRSLIQREVTGPKAKKLRLIRKYDGRPFRPIDIVNGVKSGGE